MNLEKIVFDALITYQRDELKKRYSVGTIRACGYEVPKEDVETLTEIILETFYPSIEAREQFADYIESLKSFTNPIILAGTFFVLLPVILKHGAKVKQLYRITLDALHIYKITKTNDDAVVSFTMRHCAVDKNFKFTNEIYARAYVSVPFEKREEVIECALGLTRYFRNKKLMEDIGSLLNDVVVALEKKPESLSNQAAAIKYIRDFVNKAALFFLRKNEIEIGIYTRVIEGIELRYTESFYVNKK